MALEVDTGAVAAMLAASSSDDDEVLTPKHKKTSQKKKQIFSDDEDDDSPQPSKPEAKSSSEEEPEEEVEQTKRRKSRLVMAQSSSDEEKVDEPEAKKDFGLRKIEKKSFDKLKKKNKMAKAESSEESDEEEELNRTIEKENSPKVNKSLQAMRAEFGADSSEESDGVPDGRGSSMSNKSNKSTKGQEAAPKAKKGSAPKRKSAVACKAAMEKERLKMISEKQRMERESMASLPYHRPKQRSLKEFLSARPRASLELKGAKPTLVDITVVEKELEETEKLAEEFYKPESEEEEEERFTPPPPSTPPPALATESCPVVEPLPEAAAIEPLPEAVQESVEESAKDSEFMEVDIAKKVLDFDELEEKLEALKEQQNEPEVETPTEAQPTVPEKETDKAKVEPLDNGACLTPSDAIPEKIFAVPAPPAANHKTPVEDSLEEEFHLYLEDSEDPAEAFKEQEKRFDLQEIFDKKLSDDEEEVKPSPEKPKISPQKKPMTRAQLMERLRNSKPVKLQGSSSDIIDLTESKETVADGVEQLMQRFIRNATAGKKKSLDPKQDGILKLIKAGEKLDDVDLNARPGTKMSQFKSEMQESIAKQRVVEFKQRQQEYRMYENETDELLGNEVEEDEEDCDEKSAKDKNFDEFDPHLANETESEPEPDEEDYADKPEKPRLKSAFVEEEAEVSEPEDAETDAVTKEEEGVDEEDDCDGDDENEGDCEESEDEEDGDDLTELTPVSKRNYSRIIRVEDSDDEDEATKTSDPAKLNDCKDEDIDKMDQSFASNFNTSANLSILDSPGMVGPRTGTEKSDMKIMGDMFDPTQTQKPRGMSSGITQMLQDDPEEPTETQQEAPCAVILDLNMDEESQKLDLADLCSGQFLTIPPKPSSPAPSGIPGLVTDDASQAVDIADLCSGQFVTQANEVRLADLDMPTQTQNLEELCSGQFVTQANGLDVPEKLADFSTETQTQDLAALCSGKFETQLDGDVPAIESPVKEDPEPATPKLAKLVISSDEEEEDNKENTQSQEKKKKLKKKRKLEFSDDEDDDDEAEDEEEAEEYVSEAEEAEEDIRLVDYDSEENEVVVTNVKDTKTRARRFFENEAELSGSDWGSADEDEKELDQFEEELGDKEQFDEDNVKEQLGKIHARRLLDDDKRDIRLFQEAFLEDGDLHTEGGGRQRLFRWKNTDDGDLQGGCNPNLSGDEGLDNDEEDDAAWRTMRLERETWLKEQSAKEMTDENGTENSQLLCLGKNLLAKMNGAKLRPNMEQKPAIRKTIQPMPVKSPGKAILQALQGKSGSFISRKTHSLSKYMAFASVDGDSLVTTSKKNFTFSTISPSSLKGPDSGLPDDSFEDDSPKPTKATKRQAANNPAANPRAKKHKVSNSIFKLL